MEARPDSNSYEIFTTESSPCGDMPGRVMLAPCPCTWNFTFPGPEMGKSIDPLVIP